LSYGEGPRVPRSPARPTFPPQDPLDLAGVNRQTQTVSPAVNANGGSSRQIGDAAITAAAQLKAAAAAGDFARADELKATLEGYRDQLLKLSRQPHTSGTGIRNARRK